MPNTAQALAYFPAKRLEKTFSENGVPLLTVRIEPLPLEEHSRGERRIARYYRELIRQWYRRWEGSLLTRAKIAAPAQPWQVSLRYQITLRTPQYLSLLWEVTEQADTRRPRRLRQGDIWLLPLGVPLSPTALFAPLGVHWRTTVLKEVERQINTRLQSGDCVFFEHRDSALRRYLRAEGLYLTEEGIQLFYPPCTIAPAFEGFPLFSLSELLPSPATGDRSSAPDSGK